MNLIVVGCGRMGADLAYRLYQMGHSVTVMDIVASAFNNLPPDFVGHRVEGEILAREVLHRAGIERAEGLAAVTNSDAFNAVVGHLARTVYNVPNVVVRNYDPHWRAMHDMFGFQVISSSSWAAQRTAEIISQSSLPAVFSAGDGEVEVYELMLPATWQGRLLSDLLPSEGCLAVALTRGGHSQLPTPEMTLLADDVVHVSATLDGIQSLRARMGSLREV
jgi:trk system potassium uptake protein TrkA